MSHVFKGQLCGLICTDCREALSDVIVRLYRVREGENIAALAVASAKDTAAILSDDDVGGKAGRLIAETKTDADGRFSFELGEREQYAGEAFEVDVYCASVPRMKAGAEETRPLQFTITTLQPQWRRVEGGFLAVWDYCIPFRLWCAIRARFGAWTICGTVRSCETQEPIAGLKVSAFDADWTQPDTLGAATTDGAGKFRIDYSAADFKKTPFSPFINIEWFGGPDLYFRVETGGGQVLLDEPPTRGRASDRENAGPCFCVDLCVDFDEPPPFDQPWFTHVGDFHIYSDISSATGRTLAAVVGHGGPDYGFFGALKLKGFCPKTLPGDPTKPMRYRFLYQLEGEPTPTPIAGALVSDAVIGYRPIYWKLFDDNLVLTTQTVRLQASGATPDPTPAPVSPGPWGPVPAHVIVPDSDGWVTVDQNFSDDGINGVLMRFNTTQVLPVAGAPGSGAGNPVADPKNGRATALIFEAGPVGEPAAYSNTLAKIHVNNWIEVRELNLQQFISGDSGACSGLSADLDVLYSVDHELLASWGVRIESASGDAPGTVVPPLPAGSTARGGSGTLHFDISSWASCSYRVWLDTRRRLTDGENDDDTNSLLLTFCK